jgi:hypothetical protein
MVHLPRGMVHLPSRLLCNCSCAPGLGEAAGLGDVLFWGAGDGLGERCAGAGEGEGDAVGAGAGEGDGLAAGEGEAGDAGLPHMQGQFIGIPAKTRRKLMSVSESLQLSYPWQGADKARQGLAVIMLELCLLPAGKNTC